MENENKNCLEVNMGDLESKSEKLTYSDIKHRPKRAKTLEMKYECDECDCTFNRSSLMLAHKMKHTDESLFPCTVCRKVFENNSEYINHRETQCSLDNLYQHIYHKQNIISNRQRQVSKDRRIYKCSQCTKSFKTISSKNEHERNVHNPVHKFSCNECGKSFYKKFNLNIHKEIHSDIRSHICNVCGKRFKTSQGIRMHLESHSNERRFMCEVCGKVFKTRAVLESHTAIHTGETKYNCSVCGKAYRYRSSLFIHMRTHSGHRPHTCKICNASFMVKSHLTGHMRGHTGEHPFVCMYCSASFTRAISLKKHLNSHIKAGCNVNIESAMYHAKLQAFVVPRNSYRTFNKSSSPALVPKLTHFIQGNIFLNNNKVTPEQGTFGERVELYVDQPTDEKELIVIKISSVDETGLNINSIIQTCSNELDKVSARNLLQIKSHKLRVRNLENPQYVIPINIVTNSVKDESPKEEKGKLTILEKDISYETVSNSCILDNSLINPSDRCKNVSNRNGSTCKDPPGLVVDQILKADDGSNDPIRNTSKRENKTDVSFSSSKDTESIQNCSIGIYRVKEEASDIYDFGNPDDIEHQELLLQKCSMCDKVFKCKIFVKGEEICPKCDSEKSFQTKHNYNNGPHSKSEKIDLINNSLVEKGYNTYDCGICKASFVFRSELRKHEKHHSEKYLHVCNKCGQSFQQEIFLLKHHCRVIIEKISTGMCPQISTNLSSETYENFKHMCNKCGKVFPKKYILKVHYRKHTGKKPFKCEKCPKRFISATHRKVHMRLHTGEDPYGCQTCDRSFQKRSTFKQHICKNQEWQVGAYDASVKEEPLEKNSEDTSKNVNSDASEIIKSEALDQDCSTMQEIALDEQSSHTRHSSSLKCTFCGRVFKYLSLLQAHERSHTGEKPFTCSICNKSFSKKSNMKIHMRVHTGERPFLCDICGKYFAHKYTLEAHSRLHTKERPFNCKICGKSFRHEGNKYVHMKRHLQEKKFKCDLCPKSFVAKIGLVCHRRIHTGEKPYSCDVCNRSFRVRHHLADHRRQHTGEKPYVCNVCNASFACFGTRKAHMKKHISGVV